MSNEEKKKKINDEDLSTVSGGCGSKSRKPKYNPGDKVSCNIWPDLKCTIKRLLRWDDDAKDFIYQISCGPGKGSDDVAEWRLSPRD